MQGASRQYHYETPLTPFSRVTYVSSRWLATKHGMIRHQTVALVEHAIFVRLYMLKLSRAVDHSSRPFRQTAGKPLGTAGLAF
jgi:hypothetical protein